MNAILEQRCANHAGREAVARCPGCELHYCRECVTEHGDRLLCASCLRLQAAVFAQRHERRGRWLELSRALCAFLLLWLAFYGLGRALLLMPSSFHEGTMWRADAEDGE